MEKADIELHKRSMAVRKIDIFAKAFLAAGGDYESLKAAIQLTINEDRAYKRALKEISP